MEKLKPAVRALQFVNRADKLMTERRDVAMQEPACANNSSMKSLRSQRSLRNSIDQLGLPCEIATPFQTAQRRNELDQRMDGCASVQSSATAEDLSQFEHNFAKQVVWAPPGDFVRNSMAMDGGFEEPPPRADRPFMSIMTVGALPSERSHRFKWYCKKHAIRILRSPYFDVFTGVVICINALMIGVEQTLEKSGVDARFAIWLLENCFLLVYIFDLSLWFIVYGVSCLRKSWVKLDMFFVSLGILDTWIIELLLRSQQGQIEGLMVLKILRLLRLARAVRLFYKFKAMWMIVQGLVTSMKTMGYVLSILAAIIYVFSCLGVELISNSTLNDTEPAFKEVVDYNFPNLFMTMFTLVQFANMDSVAAIYMPLVKQNMWLALYFLGVIVVIPVVLMNLITAVIVEAALMETKKRTEMNQVEERAKKADLVKKLHALCITLDNNDSGTICVRNLRDAEVADADSCHHHAFLHLCELLSAVDTEDIVAKLDIAEQPVEINVLCDGIYKMIMFDVPLQLLRVERDCCSMKKKINEVGEKVDILTQLLMNWVFKQSALEGAQRGGRYENGGRMGSMDDLAEPMLPQQTMSPREAQSEADVHHVSFCGASPDDVSVDMAAKQEKATSSSCESKAHDSMPAEKALSYPYDHGKGSLFSDHGKGGSLFSACMREPLSARAKADSVGHLSGAGSGDEDGALGANDANDATDGYGNQKRKKKSALNNRQAPKKASTGKAKKKVSIAAHLASAPVRPVEPSERGTIICHSSSGSLVADDESEDSQTRSRMTRPSRLSCEAEVVPVIAQELLPRRLWSQSSSKASTRSARGTRTGQNGSKDKE